MKMNHMIIYSFTAALLLSSCTSPANEGYAVLFDGSSLDEWVPGPEGGFEVIDGVLHTGSFGKGNDLFTKQWYCNYILRLEYLLSKVGNSGVLIRCDPEAPWKTGVEVQLLAPWTPYRDDLHCTGSLYGHVAVTNRPDETTGIWHSMEIRCDRNIITVSVDGSMATVARVDTVSTMEGKLYCGAVGLQVNHAEKEDQFARFRNIYIRDLDADPAYVSEGFFEKDSIFRSQAYRAAVHLGAGMVDPLAEIMSGTDPLAKSGARQVLFDIAARATVPGGDETYQKEVAMALQSSVGRASAAITRNYLEWLSGMVQTTMVSQDKPKDE
jgi:hypothetical protein